MVEPVRSMFDVERLEEGTEGVEKQKRDGWIEEHGGWIGFEYDR